MRRALIALATLLIALPLAAQTSQPTAEEIVARYIEAAGGMAAVQSINTLRMTGKFIGGGGFEAPVSQENKRPRKVREEFTQQGLTGINAYDGATGWKIEPWSGKKDVESLSEEELKSITEDADFDGPLVNYRAKNNTITYEGIEPMKNMFPIQPTAHYAMGGIRTDLEGQVARGRRHGDQFLASAAGRPH